MENSENEQEKFYQQANADRENHLRAGAEVNAWIIKGVAICACVPFALWFLFLRTPFSFIASALFVAAIVSVARNALRKWS